MYSNYWLQIQIYSIHSTHYFSFSMILYTKTSNFSLDLFTIEFDCQALHISINFDIKALDSYQLLAGLLSSSVGSSSADRLGCVIVRRQGVIRLRTFYQVDCREKFAIFFVKFIFEDYQAFTGVNHYFRSGRGTFDISFMCRTPEIITIFMISKCFSFTLSLTQRKMHITDYRTFKRTFLERWNTK